MSYKLIIVESPTKVSSISKYLGDKGDYKVASSMGHIRDLPTKKMNIDITNQFQPNYEIKSDKQKVVTELKKLAAGAVEVIMASDEDREGEAIAWHICHILNLDPQKTKRIVFHEITQQALEQAISNPRYINQNLVNAQQARRIMDRIVGYEISPLLWKKIAKGLSAGRVQSVAVRLVYEREQEIRNFIPKINIKTRATFKIKAQEISANLKNKLADFNQGQDLLESCRQAQAKEAGFTIADKTTKESYRNPSAPFRTSTLQQEASQKLGFSIKQTMVGAQKLYEAGFITYMRTDSLNLSDQALKQAQQYIIDKFGQNFYRSKTYSNQTKSAQEAHEAIRPTNFEVEEVTKLDQSANKLYKLIHSRTLASQMQPALIDKEELSVNVDQSPYVFIIQGQRLRFEGFLAATQDHDKDVILPDCQIGDNIQLLEATIFENFSSAPSRYSEASLVKKMEELGIGRPSTYAPTINNIIDREYVVKGDIEPQIKIYTGYTLEQNEIKPFQSEDKWGGATNKLIPTSLAELVIPFLTEHFKKVMDYEFTSSIEEEFDQIAIGELDWIKQLQQFYNEFHPMIEEALEVSKEEITKMRTVGIDPKDGKTIYARIGRFGPYLQKGTAQDSDEKPLSAQIPDGKTIETVSLKEAITMFNLPRLIGSHPDGSQIMAKSGPYGAYLENNKIRVPLKEYDPFSISLEEAIRLIEAKKEAENNKIVVTFNGLKIVRGPFGPYITDSKKNAKIPKEYHDNPEQITKEQAQTWFKEKAKAPRRRKRSA